MRSKSGQGDVAISTLVVADRLPAASSARTPSVYIVPHARPATANCVVAVEPTRLPPLRIS